MSNIGIREFAARRQMSLPVADAIFEAVGNDYAAAVVLADNPTPEQSFLVNDRAFEIAGPNVETLDWGLCSSEIQVGVQKGGRS